MPQSIPKGLTRAAVLQAIADLDAGIEHPFGLPTGYELVHDGRRYPPKAVIGLACRSLLGRVLLPEEFSGGEAPGQANYVLRELGFAVVRKGDEVIGEDPEESGQGRDWTSEEVDLVIADYFAMLAAELSRSEYSKADHNKELRPLLSGRSKGSVEFKHQNISAVLLEMGLPYIPGYKPARNYQKALLPQAVAGYLARNSSLLDMMAESPLLNPPVAPEVGDRDTDDIFVPRPDQVILPVSDQKPWLSRRGKRIDFTHKDAHNRRLGQLGEKFTVDVERRRLLLAGRDDLAAKVEWVALTCGDGLGFDILSFDEADDSEQFLEVKTTGLGKHFPFYVTVNEVRCSEDCPGQFRLYRVFEFARVPRIYVVSGPLSRECRLEPVVYRAST
jgi:Domain of unknown function (DUF3883)